MGEDLMRGEYRKLTVDEQRQVDEIKDWGNAFIAKLGRAQEAAVVHGRPDGRCISIAKTKAEEAVMWAVKAITG